MARTRPLALEDVLPAILVLQRADRVGDEHLMVTAGTGILLAGFLVTSRHVFERNGAIYLRLGEASRPSRFALTTRGGDGRPRFAHHPEPKVDLAAMRVEPPGGALQLLLSRDVLHRGPLQAGQEILVAGFHPDIAPEGVPTIVVRRGAVAVAPPSAFAGGRGFLVDAAVAPGMSGSAVLVESAAGVRLGGVIEGYVPSRRSLVDPRTGRPASLVEESSGFAVAVGIDALLETLAQAVGRKERSRRGKRGP